MAEPTLTDEQLAEKYGRRPVGAVSLFAPFEWGYRCPAGHRGENITWSEFKEHIWCKKCELDYPVADCPMQRPSWMDPTEFKAFVARLPFKPKILPGVDHSLELLDKAEKRLKGGK
ncbi:unnamed protein product [marine sediment metagenome]|uniref:Uncharacterized protein n=1 Tax=marine sediment metagenome TaxID=412755 RepID=X1HK99_9ZZZZ